MPNIKCLGLMVSEKKMLTEAWTQTRMTDKLKSECKPTTETEKVHLGLVSFSKR